MIKCKDIDTVIHKLLEYGGMNRSTYEQLGWLFIIKDHMKPDNEAKTTMYDMMELEPVAPEYGECDRECKLAWVNGMVNEDGTKGAHWSMEQTKNVLRQRDSDISPEDFYVAMNMMYSDYYKVAKRFNVNTVDFYACMAEAFLMDKDVPRNKLSNYYEYVVK